MKKIFHTLLLMLVMQLTRAQYVTIPDAGFASWLSTHGFSSCMSGNRMDTTCAAIRDTTSLQVGAANPPIYDLTGIQYFKSVTTLTIFDTYSTTYIPALPASVTTYTLNSTDIASISNLPPNLESLTIYNCPHLSAISAFPNTIESISISGDDSLTVLPAFPTALTSILIQNAAMITALPAWPNNLLTVDLQYFPVTILPPWPASVTGISLIDIPVTQLPALPSSLQNLYMTSVPASNITAFPSSLYSITIEYDNSLTSLPALPASLHNLELAYTAVSVLPALPPLADTINCPFNLLTSLPDSMPNSVMVFDCSDNQLTSLPALSNRLLVFDCNDNPGITCLPYLPISLQVLEFSNTSVTCAPNYLPTGGDISETPLLSSLPLCQPGNSNGCYAVPIPAGPDQTICINSTATMAATDTGTWIALSNNPAITNISNPTSPTTAITGFTVAGLYGFKWGILAGDTVYITVSGSLQPQVNVTGGRYNICNGETDTLVATPVNGGTSPVYQWYFNGNSVGANSPVYITPALTTAGYDTIWVHMVSSLACAGATGWGGVYDSVAYVYVLSLPAAPTLTLAGGSCFGKDSIELSGVFGAAAQFNWFRNGHIVDSTPAPPAITIVGGGNGSGSGWNQLSGPGGIYVTNNGDVYVADVTNLRVQKFTAGVSSYINGVTVAGGNGQGETPSTLSDPTGVWMDAGGYLYVTDNLNNRVQKFPPGSTSASDAVTVAGGNGPGSAANQLSGPSAVFVDATGYIYVADEYNSRIQKFPPGSDSATNGLTVAGTGTSGSAANELSDPVSIAVDAAGNLYVCDYRNYRIQKFPAGSTAGTNAITVAGGNGAGSAANQFQYPQGIALDASGNLYVADYDNFRIQKFPAGSTSLTNGITVAGGNGTGVGLNQIRPFAVFVDATDAIYVSDGAYNFRIEKWIVSAIDSLFNPPSAGNYTATYIDTDGCTSALSNSVALANCNNTDTVTICKGSSYTMQNIAGGSNADTYLWIPPTGLSSNVVLDPVANPVVTTKYTLIAVDTTGIAYYDTVLIIVDSVCTGFVWPGDADDNGIVDNTDLLPIGLTYGFTGPARPQQDINWYAHSATPWVGTNSGGINNVYADCDGNGLVDVIDVQAILQNYSLTHAKTNAESANRSGAPVLKITVSADTVANADTLICHLILGDSITPATNVYGLAFTFNFNPLVVDTSSVKMTFPDSWLATQSEHISLAKNEISSGNIYAGLSRINQVSRSGSGEIATVSMVITTDNIDGKNLNYYTDQLSLTAIKVIDQLGDTIPVNSANDSAIIGFLPLGILNTDENPASVKLFPDPANKVAHLRSVGGRMSGLILTDVLGRQIGGYYAINASNFDLPVSDLIPGVYFGQIVIGNNTVVKKFLVQH